MKDTEKSPEVSILESVGAMMQQNNITSGVDGNASYITNNQVVLVQNILPAHIILNTCTSTGSIQRKIHWLNATYPK